MRGTEELANSETGIAGEQELLANSETGITWKQKRPRYAQ